MNNPKTLGPLSKFESRYLIDPNDACGAAHSVTYLNELGVETVKYVEVPLSEYLKYPGNEKLQLVTYAYAQAREQAYCLSLITEPDDWVKNTPRVAEKISKENPKCK